MKRNESRDKIANTLRLAVPTATLPPLSNHPQQAVINNYTSASTCYDDDTVVFQSKQHERFQSL